MHAICDNSQMSNMYWAIGFKLGKTHCLETVWKGLSCLENFSFPDGSKGIIGDKGLARSVFPDMHKVTIVIESSG